MTNPQPAPTLREQTVIELKKIEQDLLWTEKTHFALADTFRSIHFGVGGVATVAGAGAATSVISDGSPVLSAILAVIGALASALVTFVKPQETQQKYLLAGRRLGALRVEVRQAVTLDLHPDAADPTDGLRTLAANLAAQKAQVDQSSPSTSNRAFRKAREKIEAGNFDHDSPPPV